MVLVIDNYDSFTWNLVDLLRRHAPEVAVFRNDKLTPDDIIALRPAGIVISPGPGRPKNSGISSAALGLAGDIAVLGVCLGHQLIGELYGGRVVHAGEPMHGRTSRVVHDGNGVFAGLPPEIKVMRYHSLVLEPASLQENFTISARTDNGVVMGIRHKFRNFEGVQFHPESILTEGGDRMVRNWVETIWPEDC